MCLPAHCHLQINVLIKKKSWLVMHNFGILQQIKRIFKGKFHSCNLLHFLIQENGGSHGNKY